MAKISRREYAQLYGPTTGDGVRLGDTSLIAEIEHDHAVPGDECLHGGGKTLRDGLGLTPGYDSAQGALDMLISNAVIVDPVLGVVKGDIGIKDGRIVAIGKAGNPAIMDGVHPKLICAAATTVRDAEGLIATPGGIDVHVHFDSAQLVEHAISSGLTTMIGGSLGPITVGIDCGGEWNVGKMLQASEHWPMNFGFLGRGNSSKPRSLIDQLAGGCLGLKIHEDWGAMPAVIDTCLAVADDLDFQVQLHTDTLNESGFLEDSLAAINGRTIHMYHTEGAGGGHAPDIIAVAGQMNCLPSSTPDQPLHRQHLRRAPGYDHGVPPSESGRAGRCGLRRVAHPRTNHRRRGCVARHGGDLDAGLRQSGHGTHQRGDCAHLAARVQDEGPAWTAGGGKVPYRGQRAHQTLRREVHDQRGTHLRHRPVHRPLEAGKLAEIVVAAGFFGVKPELVVAGSSCGRRWVTPPPA
jgi:urease alpha subunit